MNEYERWLSVSLDDPDLTEELQSIQGKPEEINDRFYRNLEFGTGGLRGVIGAGTNRMNVYTVRKATQGLSNYLNKHKAEGVTPSVAIAHDSRIKSDVFARESAAVLAANGIKAYLYPQLMPTPALSYAVRYLKCDAGICVTASHNPAKYNGYKAYGSDGCQVTLEMADEILAEINSLDIFEDVKKVPFEEGLESGLIQWIGEDCVNAFLDDVQSQSVLGGTDGSLRIVYTPLNGSGKMCVTRILDRIGVTDVHIVPEQSEPDGNFPTCPFPNPEIREALQKGLELCEKVEPTLLLATDPDCDRVGVQVARGGEFVPLNGNELGALLIDYLCLARAGQFRQGETLVTTVVSGELGQRVARAHGIEVKQVLTGFKFIGDQAERFPAQGRHFFFGYEESYGYLTGDLARDKDAVLACAFVAEMALYWQAQGKDLLDRLEEIEREHGYCLEKTVSRHVPGLDFAEKIASRMAALRDPGVRALGGLRILAVEDYLNGVRRDFAAGKEQALDVPKADVLKFFFAEGTLAVRPSGTEPNIKFYCAAGGSSREQAAENLARVQEAQETLFE